MSTVDKITNCILLETTDSDSFHYLPSGFSGVPTKNHVGAFGAVRKKHIHEGVDIYLDEGHPIHSNGVGIIKAIIPFTGSKCNSGWWHDTEAVVVSYSGGDVLYGEIIVNSILRVGDVVTDGQLLGHITPVLKKDKGRPMSMLHLERYNNFTTPFEWYDDNDTIPVTNPTDMLNFIPYEPTTLFVCGYFGVGESKRSKYCDSLLMEHISTTKKNNVCMVNGGGWDKLNEVLQTIGNYDKVIWIPNIDNSYEKLVKEIVHPNLIISKNNRDMSYTSQDLLNRINAAGASSLVEFNKQNGLQYRIHSVETITEWYNGNMELIKHFFGD